MKGGRKVPIKECWLLFQKRFWLDEENKNCLLALLSRKPSMALTLPLPHKLYSPDSYSEFPSVISVPSLLCPRAKNVTIKKATFLWIKYTPLTVASVINYSFLWAQEEGLK